jgi:hypothetical protein
MRAADGWPRSASSVVAFLSPWGAASKIMARSPDDAIVGRMVAPGPRVFRAIISIPGGVRHQRASGYSNPYVLAAITALCMVAGPPAAFAHVKWFSPFDVSEQPMLLEQVVSGAFCKLLALALIVFFVAALLDRSPLGTWVQRVPDRLTAPIHHKTDTLIRAVYGAFFVALWVKGEIILTPELKTTAGWVPWLQLAIAAGMLSRPTMIFSGLGIAVLFGYGLSEYGAFHLMDYPIFLGAAAYLILAGSGLSLFGIRSLDVVRYAAAVTLMWASVEKWAYPQWTYPLLVAHPEMTFGFDSAFYMTAAGVVEFSLAFALAWTPLFRRVAALVLAIMFVMAVFEFGKIDAIGHSAIIVILLAIVADHARDPRRHHLWATEAWYAVAIAGFMAVYYVAHAELFGTAII